LPGQADAAHLFAAYDAATLKLEIIARSLMPKCTFMKASPAKTGEISRVHFTGSNFSQHHSIDRQEADTKRFTSRRRSVASSSDRRFNAWLRSRDVVTPK
jgi:hypothetical protein